MKPINLTRVLSGGLLVGFILSISEMILHRVALAPAWKALLGADFDLWQSFWMILALFVLGITSVWLYVIFRDRFGPGPKTALLTGLTVWVLVALVPGMVALFLGYLSVEIVVTILVWRLVELPIALHAGAAPYREGVIQTINSGED